MFCHILFIRHWAKCFALSQKTAVAQFYRWRGKECKSDQVVTNKCEAGWEPRFAFRQSNSRDSVLTTVLLCLVPIVCLNKNKTTTTKPSLEPEVGGIIKIGKILMFSLF